jgi:integrase
VSGDPFELRPSGHVQVIERHSGRRYFAVWRDAEGRHKQLLGPAWVKRSGRRTARGAFVWRAADGPKPDPSYLTPDEAAFRLREILAAAPKRRRVGVAAMAMTFGELAEEWLAHGERKRRLKRSTLTDYRQVLDCYLLPAFGARPLREITAEAIERWHVGFDRPRTAEKLLMVMRAIFNYAIRRGVMGENPAVGVERPVVRYSGDYDFYTRAELDALIAAAASEQDAAIYLTAALTGLRRGELVALRWRDVDFAGHAIRVRANYSHGELVTPKSGKVRVVPMVDEVAQRLARLSQRETVSGDDDPVFVGAVGLHLDASALRRRYRAAAGRAGLRVLPFHSLRHFFGSMAVNRASLVQVQAWMGHSAIQTTARYLHHRSQATDAALLSEAFAPPLVAGANGRAKRAPADARARSRVRA